MPLARYYAGRFVRECLPTGAARQVHGLRTRLAAWRDSRATRLRLARFGEFTPEELYRQLLSNGVRPGTVLLVHSSFGSFTNFRGNAADVVSVLGRIAGDRGTLIMPSQPSSKRDLFDVQRSPASTGLVCELFRRAEGVVRSLHPGQSVCARGPSAEALTFEHHLQPLGCGELSPFAKLIEYDSQILGLGLPPLWTTFLHVVEDLDLPAFPVEIYDGQQRKFRVIDADRVETEVVIPRRDDRVLSQMNLSRMRQRVSESALNVFSVNGIPMFTAEPQVLLEELQALAGRGVTIYS